jgi:hypothetical protein
MSRRSSPAAAGLEDRLGKRIGPLEDHADAMPDDDRVGIGRVDILSVKHNGTFDARTGRQVVHPVERAQKRRLPATGRSDEGRHGLRGHLERGVLDRLKRTVVDADIRRAELFTRIYGCR